MKREKLAVEQELIILLGRYTLSERDETAVVELLENQINWYLVLQYAIKNKIVGLVYFNLKKIGKLSKVEHLVLGVFKAYYEFNKEKNIVLLSERKNIEENFKDVVTILPLKGAVLLKNLYSDLGSRSLNDLDYMIDIDDIGKAREVMRNIGYSQGDYDVDSKKITPFSREKKMVWQMNLNTVPIFLKNVDSVFCDLVQVDFSYSLDLKKDAIPVKEIIQESKADGMSKAHFFVHLCSHLYKEAGGAIWIYSNADLSLIKFCDVREYLLKFMSEENFIEAYNFAKKYNVVDAIFYCLYYIKLIYNDEFVDKYLTRIECKNNEILNRFGEDDLGKVIQWKSSFFERMFAISNREELEQNSDFIYKHKKFIDM